MKVIQLILTLFVFLFSNLGYSATTLSPPTILSPLNNAQNVSTTLQNFSWSAVTDATTYRIVVVEAGHFADFVDNGGTSSCSLSSDKITCFTEKPSITSFSGFSLKPNTNYELRVRAGSATIPNSTWTFSTFTTAPVITTTSYSVSISVSGTGTVTSLPAGINCSSGSLTGCTAQFDSATTVTLQATAGSGFTFSSWGQDCSSSGSASSCAFKPTANKTVTANFTAVNTSALTLNLTSSNLQGSPGSLFASPDTQVNLSFKTTGSANSIEVDWFGDGKTVDSMPVSSDATVTFSRSFPSQKAGKVITWSATAYKSAKTVKSNMVQGSFYVLEKSSDCFVYVKDVTVPDGTVFSPGATFNKTWAVKNCGSTTWNNYQLAYLSGSKLGTVASVVIAPNGTAPGGVVNITVPMKTPGTPGRYRSYWKAKNASNQFFDRFVYAEIQSYIPGSTKRSGTGGSNRIAQSNLECTIKTGNPIDTATGSQNYTLNLLSVSGLRNINFIAHYSSLVLSSSPMGQGWGHNYETYLKKLADNNIRVSWRSNREDYYDLQSNGTYLPRTKEVGYSSLVKNADGSFLLTRKDKAQYFFNVDGQLLKETNSQGQALLYSYNPDGFIVKVTEPTSGVYLQFNYDASLQLASVNDPLGRKVEFSYDGEGHLTGYKNALSQQTSYTLNTNGQVISAVNPENIKLFENTFDTEGRITYQKRTRDIPNDLFSINYAGDTGGSTYPIVAKDHFGKSKTVTYQDEYVIKEFIDELGNKTQIQYDAKNNPIKIINAKTRTFEQTFDSRGNLTSVKNPLGQVISMTYDGNDNLISRTDANGKTTAYTYDNNHNVLTVTFANAKVTKFTYTAEGKIATVTTPKGYTTNYSYQNGRLSSITDPQGNKTSFQYDLAGRLTGITDAEGFTTTLVLDNLDRVVQVIDALGNSTKNTYNSRGDILTSIDANGNTRYFSYDGNRNLISSIDALGNMTQYEYDANDRLIKITDPKTISTVLGYDDKGRLSKVTDALGNTLSYQYDKTDQLVKKLNPFGQETLYNYDKIDNLVSITNALNQSAQFEYDKNNNVVAVTDPLKRKTLSKYDALNRLIESTDALQGKSSQVFSDEGEVISLTDPNNNKTAFEYDSRNLLTKETTASGITKKYTYNARRLISSITNGRGQVQTISFDKVGRPTKLVDAVGTIDVTYDANGNVLTVKDANGTITRTYDKLNRVTSYTNTAGEKIGYGYDANSNLTTLIYPSVVVSNGDKSKTKDKSDNDHSTGIRQVTYGYDVLNRLVKVTDWANRVVSYEYDKESRLVKTTRPNGSVETRTYNAIGQLVELKDITTKKSEEHHDNKKDKENGGSSSKQELIYQVNYEYDAVGNILKETVLPDVKIKLPTSKAMTYSAGNRISQFAGKTFDFDGDGNMIKVPFNGVSDTLSFNARNQLVSGLGLSYLYDAEGYRVQQIKAKKSDNNHSEHKKEDSGNTNGNSNNEGNSDHSDNSSSTVIRYTVNPEAILSQVLVQTEGQNKTYFVYGLGLIGQELNNTYHSYHFDYRGSTVAMTNSVGSVVDRYSYTPFADESLHTNSPRTPFRYNGRDGVTTDSNGLYYMRARYFSPELHRFVSQDVLLGNVARGSSLNRYGFVEGNPLSGIDPLGLEYTSAQYDANFKAVDNEVVSYIADNCYGENATTWGCLKAKALMTGVAVGEVCADFVVKPAVSCKDNPGLNLDCTSTALTFTPVKVGAVVKGEATIAKETITVTKAVTAETKVIGATGKVGEEFLKGLGGESQVYFNTTLGGRYIDQLINGVANESKVGYQSLTKGIKLQIAKDAELLKDGKVNEVIWHSFISPETGKGGFSKPLLKALQDAGFKIITH